MSLIKEEKGTFRITTFVPCANQRKKKPKQCISSKTKSTCQNSTTSEHFQKWPKNQGVVLALSLSIVVMVNEK